MNNRYKVVIVGGGTAGWMTASYLRKALGHDISIRLIESPNIGPVGVGEATFSDIHLFFEFLELREEDWMPYCNAGYKLAIRFVDWNKQRRTFYHPFQRFEIVQGRSIGEWWLKLKRHSTPCDYACFTVPALCDAQRSPRYMDGRVFDSRAEGLMGPSESGVKPVMLDDLQMQYPYAYHFDAALLAKFLSRFAQLRGVEQLADDVLDVQLDESGYISGLITKEHGEVKADLFVDCTGFRGLLINKTLKEPFITFSESLPCDSAIAMQVPSDPAREGINPYTTATALSSGWVWDIPLFHRTGTGYVYSSAFVSPEAAEREFREHLNSRGENCNALHIKMRVGRNRNSWVKNCVAIGLSSGFVEPLESTGIFFIHNGIEQLVNHFPSGPIREEDVRSHNKAVAECIDGVRDFLILHYVAASRDDTPFWKATKELVVPERLAECLQLWKVQLPNKRTINQSFHGFTAFSYCLMLLGLGDPPQHSLPGLPDVGDDAALAAFDDIQRRAAHLTRSLPPLYDYLRAKYERESAGALTGAGVAAR
jgi:tryptophan halogenase